MRQSTDLLSPVIGIALTFAFASAPSLFASKTNRYSLPVVSLKVQNGVDVSYNGEYRKDLGFSNGFEPLEHMRARALGKAESVTGLTCQDPERFVVRLKDANPGFGASSQPVRSQSGEVQLVTLAANQIALGVMDMEAALVHEFIHSLMRSHMGESLYLSVPPWVREGIAVWGADQLPELIGNAIAEIFLDGRDPRSLLADLDGNTRPSEFYLAVALAFEYLSDNHGASAIRNLIADLVEGWDAAWAIARSTGTTLGELESQRTEFARMYFEAAVAMSGLEEFLLAQSFLQRGDLDKAQSALRQLIVNRPNSLLVPHAWYWLGRTWSARGQNDLAASAYRLLISQYPEYRGLQADARLRLLACLRALAGLHSVPAEWLALQRTP